MDKRTTVEVSEHYEIEKQIAERLRFSTFTERKIFIPTVAPYKIIEKLLGIFPQSLRKLLTFNKIIRFLLGVKLVGTK